MHDHRYQQAKKTTLIGAAINITLGVFKLIFGYMGNSQALIADGAHSLSDLITDALVLLAAKFGSHKPDLEHPYGHGRIETIVTIAIAIIVAGVGFIIAYDALRYIVIRGHYIHPGISAIIVATISIFAKEWLYRYTLAASKKIHSKLLRANAWHNRSDALISIVVLIGILGTIFGVHYLDAAAAIIVGLLVVKMGAEMIWDSIQELIDTGVDKKTLSKIKECIIEVDGVNSIHQLRTRSLAGSIFVDVHVLVDSLISVSEGHYISDQVYLTLQKNFPHISDVIVHVDAEDDEAGMLTMNLPSRKHLEKTLHQHWQNLPYHEDINKVIFHYLGGKISIEIFIRTELAVTTTEKHTLTKKYQQAISHIHHISSLIIHWN